MPRYLVTGGAGFIGSHLCETLLVAGHAVRVIDDLSSGRRENVPSAAELRVGDAADRAVVAAAAADVDGVFHLAGLASVERCAQDPIAAHRANQTATVVVLEVARALGRLPVVLASSAAVYGDQGPLLLAETAPPRPLTGYGVDKLGAELHAALAWERHRVPSAALRIFNAFGPRQSPLSDYAGVISLFAARLASGGPLLLHGDGQQIRDFVHVADVVQHLEAAMNTLAASPRAIVCNVCTGRPIAIAGLARRMAELAGRRGVAIRHAPARAGDVRHSVGDPGRAIRELGVRAETGLDKGLQELLRQPPAQ